MERCNKIYLTMPIVRFLQPLLLALALLFAQQGGALHTLSHSFAEQTQQKNKQTPHSPACEQCPSYAQLGSALNSAYFSFELNTSLTQAGSQHRHIFYAQHTPDATARGPPAFSIPI